MVTAARFIPFRPPELVGREGVLERVHAALLKGAAAITPAIIGQGKEHVGFGWRCRRLAIHGPAPDLDGARDVLDLVRAHIREFCRQLVIDFVVDLARDTNSARRRD